MHNLHSAQDQNNTTPPQATDMDRRTFLQKIGAAAAATTVLGGGAVHHNTEAGEENGATRTESVPVSLPNAQMVRGFYDSSYYYGKMVETNGYWSGEYRNEEPGEKRPSGLSYQPVTLVEVQQGSNRVTIRDAWASPRELEATPSQQTVERIRRALQSERTKYWTILVKDGDTVKHYNGAYDERSPEAGEEPLLPNMEPATVHIKEQGTTMPQEKNGWIMTRNIPVQKEEKEEGQKNCCDVRVVYINTSTNTVEVDPRARFEIVLNIQTTVSNNVTIERQDWFPEWCTCRRTGNRNAIRSFYSTNSQGVFAYACPNTHRYIYFRRR